jgi:hypothetical protein
MDDSDVTFPWLPWDLKGEAWHAYLGSNVMWRMLQNVLEKPETMKYTVQQCTGGVEKGLEKHFTWISNHTVAPRR